MSQKVLNLNLEWVAESCCNCGVSFAVPKSLWRQWKNDSDHYFYCPNGHRQHYTEGDVQRERRLREEAEHRTEMAQKRREWAEQESRRADYRARAAKGQLTKMKNRVSNGTCPCCQRTFSNLARHMATKHPEMLEQIKDIAEKEGG